MQVLRHLCAIVVAISLVMITAVPVHADYARATFHGSELQSVVQGLSKKAIWGEWSIRYPSTYDGDGIIAAKVRDVRTDGSCVAAIYEDGDVPYLQAVSCRGWTNHLFFDQTGDSQAWVRVDRTRYWDHEHWAEATGY